MRRLVVALWTCALAILAFDARAIVRRHDREDARYLAAGDRFPMVGLLGQRVSCTLIAPRWVITAAHTVEQRNPFTPLEVRFGDRTYRVVKIIIHPHRKRGAVDSSADLVLLQLAEPPRDVTPAGLYAREDEPETIASIVGWGEAGTGLTGPVIERGKRRAATNRIEGALENSLLTVFDAPPRGTDLEGSTGPGDSGGALMITSGASPQLAGVDSFNGGSVDEGTASRYGVFNAFARISTRRQWILDTMAGDPPSTEWMPLEPMDTWSGDSAQAARAFFAAFNSRKQSEVARFIARYRPPGAKSAEERAAAWDELMTQYAPYEVHGFSRGRDGRYAVLVYSAAAKQWRGVGFAFSNTNPAIVASLDMWDAIAPGSGAPEDAR